MLLATAAAAVMPTRSLVQAAEASTRVSSITQASGYWTPLPIVSKAIRDKLSDRGLPDLGGEGGQWVGTTGFAPDGQTAIWGTDVGGLFRTLDGGRTWEPCNVGFTPRGACMVAFDPRDVNRIIIVAANSLSSDHHGIYVSTNRGASWRHVFSANYSGMRDFRHQLVFDPNSDAVYWSRVADDKAIWGKTVDDPALYVSDDRGESWKRLDDSEKLGGATLAHHPKEPTLYIAAPDGFYTMSRGETSASKISDEILTGLDCSPAMPSRLVGTTETAVVFSEDGGKTWTRADGSDAVAKSGTKLLHIRVSPVDGDRMGLFRSGPNYDWTRHVSHDGGKTFIESKFEGELDFLPRNARQARFAWSAVDADVVLASGGDWPCVSEDGGKTFRWSGAGVNNIYSATAFQFCPDDPQIMLLSSQDYNGALTLDGGHTWKYMPISGSGWGGFTYGAAAASQTDLWAGLSRSWGGERMLTQSTDGGDTWDLKKEIVWIGGEGDKPFGYDVCYCDPRDASVHFAGPYRSGDAGKSWRRMDGCHGVMHDAGNLLFGGQFNPKTKRGFVVASGDHGKTWHTVAETGKATECSYDASRDRLYVTAVRKLYRLDGVGAAFDAKTTVKPIEVGLPRPPEGVPYNGNVGGVAVDPKNPSTVYATRSSGLLVDPYGALQSKDAGKTWKTLHRLEPLATDKRDPKGLDGGNSPMRVRVHPTDGRVWFTTGCYGLWTWQNT